MEQLVDNAVDNSENSESKRLVQEEEEDGYQKRREDSQESELEEHFCEAVDPAEEAEEIPSDLAEKVVDPAERETVEDDYLDEVSEMEKLGLPTSFGGYTTKKKSRKRIRKPRQWEAECGLDEPFIESNELELPARRLDDRSEEDTVSSTLDDGGPPDDGNDDGPPDVLPILHEEVCCFSFLLAFFKNI